MNPSLTTTTSTLTAIFGLTLTVLSYSLPVKAATMNMDSGMVDLGPADAQFDLRFIDNMTVHHQGAVEMAEDALNKSERDEIEQLSQEIIATQTSEIDQLQEWRQAWYPNAGSPMNMDSGMMNMDLGAADAEFDLRFIDSMTMHHQGAIDMAEDALNKSERDEIEQLSQNIIATQSSEIGQLQEWRQAWYPNADHVAAVPEPPATLGLLTMGTFGIASVLKRQRTKSKSVSIVSK